MRGANTIVPSAFQAPPCGDPARVAIVLIDRLSMANRLTFESAKKPMALPSGDQNGKVAISVPGKGSAEAESNARMYSCGRPLARATKTTLRPSGEIANANGSAVEGVVISSRVSGASGRENAF